MKGDERKALIVSDLLLDVNSAIDGSGRSSPRIEAEAAVLGDALTEYGYPTLSDDFREWLDSYIDGDWRLSMPRWDTIYHRIESAARELARGDHEIQDPNSSGQGYAPSHVDTPFHDALRAYDFGYSHTTRVWRPYYNPKNHDDVRRGPENMLLHTYRSGPRTVSVGLHHEGYPEWVGGLKGHQKTRGTTVEGLESYLRGVRRREHKYR